MNESIKILIPTIASIVAAIFSILTYKRNRRIENENFIYKSKVEIYTKILGELSNLINKLDDYALEFSDYIELSKLTDDQIDEVDLLADKVDDLIDSVNDTLISNTLILPQNVLSEIEIFSSLLYDMNVPYIEENEENNNMKVLAIFNHYITQVVDGANTINEKMRVDLRIDELNQYLFKRISK